MSALDFDDVEALAELLRTGGIRSVDTDPAKVQTPGVWIAVRRVSLDNLDGVTIGLDLVAVVPASAPRLALPKLAALFNQVKAVLDANGLGGPDDDTRVVDVVFPGSQSPLPGLSIPLDLQTT